MPSGNALMLARAPHRATRLAVFTKVGSELNKEGPTDSMSDISLNGMFDLTGKTALITGGSRGLGLHAATALLLAGAKTLFITARKAADEQGIDQAVERLNDLAAKEGLKGRAIGIAANVAQEEDIKRLVEEVKNHEGTLDILIANAGATWGGPFEVRR